MPDIYEIEIVSGSSEPIELEYDSTPLELETEVVQTDRPVGYSIKMIFEFDDGTKENAFIYGKSVLFEPEEEDE